MNVVARLLTPNDIRLEVEVSEKLELFEQIGQLMEQRHGLSHDSITRGLLRREKAGSTCLGQGVAIPHARFAGLPQTQALYFRPRPRAWSPMPGFASNCVPAPTPLK